MKAILFSLFTIFSFGLLYVHTAITVFITLPLSILKQKRMVKWFVKLWAKGSFLIIGKKLHIEGYENIEGDKKYILLANHSSLFDIMAIMAFLPEVSWFGREHLLRIPLFGQILKMIDYIPMKKGNIRQTKEMLGQLIEKSGSKTIAIFPEGTRTLDSNLGRFHKGFLHVQKSTNRDLLPVTLNGFFRLKPKNRFYIDYRSHLKVIIHKPFYNNLIKEMNDKQVVGQVKSIMESELI